MVLERERSRTMLALRRSEAGKREIKPAGPVMRFFKREKVAGWLFVAPWVIGFLAFNLYPLLATIYNSFTKLGLFGQAQWIGLKNYQQLFTQDAIFAKAISNMLIYVLSTTAIYIVGGLVLALLLHKK